MFACIGLSEEYREMTIREYDITLMHPPLRTLTLSL